jgi:transketolase
VAEVSAATVVQRNNEATTDMANTPKMMKDPTEAALSAIQDALQVRVDDPPKAPANPESAQQLDTYLSGEAPKLDWDAIAAGQTAGVATRASSGYVLAHFAEHVGNMIVMSADLANSDKTDAFLKSMGLSEKAPR